MVVILYQFSEVANTPNAQKSKFIHEIENSYKPPNCFSDRSAIIIWNEVCEGISAVNNEATRTRRRIQVKLSTIFVLRQKTC